MSLLIWSLLINKKIDFKTKFRYNLKLFLKGVYILMNLSVIRKITFPLISSVIFFTL